jgi:TetR/AcrR family transcriptional repressor of uid operon
VPAVSGRDRKRRAARLPKLKPETLAQRRDHILDAAERCFARNGFHSASMQMICREAGVSAGALYIYFPSKEALIAGICERDRAEFLERFSEVASADDFLAAIDKVATHYFIEEEVEKLALTVETGAEATRNGNVREMMLECDRAIGESFSGHLEQLARSGRIDPVLPPGDVAKLMQVLGDGLMWRRAIDPDFDATTLLPAVLQLVGLMVRPGNSKAPSPDEKKAEEASA